VISQSWSTGSTARRFGKISRKAIAHSLGCRLVRQANGDENASTFADCVLLSITSHCANARWVRRIQASWSYIQLILTSPSFTTFSDYMSECHSADRKKRADNGASVIETAEKGEEQAPMQIEECTFPQPPLQGVRTWRAQHIIVIHRRIKVTEDRFTDDDLILLPSRCRPRRR